MRRLKRLWILTKIALAAPYRLMQLGFMHLTGNVPDDDEIKLAGELVRTLNQIALGRAIREEVILWNPDSDDPGSQFMVQDKYRLLDIYYESRAEMSRADNAILYRLQVVLGVDDWTDVVHESRMDCLALTHELLLVEHPESPRNRSGK